MTTQNVDAQDAATSANLTVERRNDKSMLMRILLTFSRAIRPYLVKPKKGSDDTHDSPRLVTPKRVSRSHDVQERNVDSIWVYDVARKSSLSDNEPRTQISRRIYYFAGGGWQMPPSPHHWAFIAALVDRLPQTSVSLISYPLAPENPASVSMPKLKTLYDTLMKQSSTAKERVIIAGDSAGGNIALSLVLWSLAGADRGQASHPDAIMAISPSTDLRHRNAEMEAVARHDPTLTIPFVQSTAAAWSAGGNQSADLLATDWTVDDARVSPTLARIELAARHNIQIHGVVGTWDVLAPEAMEFIDKCRDAGVRGKWLVWEGQMHCFPLAARYHLSESVEASKWIARVISEV